MKRYQFPDGAVLSHPFEMSERSQEASADNISELLGALFSTLGVLSPYGDSLLVSMTEEVTYYPANTVLAPGTYTTNSGDMVLAGTSLVPRHPRANGPNLSLRVNAGDAIVAKGLLSVPSAFTVSISKAEHLSQSVTEKTLFLNLLYAETEDTPVDVLPFGSGEANIRRIGTYRVAFETAEPAAADGVALARIVLGTNSTEVEDLRAVRAARLRADATIAEGLIDPDLVPEMNRLLKRENVVDEILDLLVRKRLHGGYVVTEAGLASPPAFVRTRREPSVRERIRQRSIASAGDAAVWSSAASPDPSWDVVAEWNVYGVQVDRITSTEFRVFSAFDLTTLSRPAGNDPYFLRFGGADYEVVSFLSANTVSVSTPVPGALSSDPSGAIHNGVSEVQVYAEPDRKTGRILAEKPSQVVVDHVAAESMRARLKLSEGAWRVSLNGSTSSRRSTHTLTQQVPSLAPPAPVASIALSPYQFEPAYAEVNTGAIVDANPFEKIQIGPNGEPLIDASGIDRFAEAVGDELRRIQEMEVSLTATVSFTPRLQSEQTSGTQMTIGCRVQVEMLTRGGWKPFASRTVYRPVDDLVREIAWMDIGTDRYRGEVPTASNMVGLAADLSPLGNYVTGQPIRDGEIVRVASDPTTDARGYYRYEARLASAPSGVRSYSMEGGYWVQMSASASQFQPRPIDVVFQRMSGGADYRVTVSPVGELGAFGSPLSQETQALRTLYNARLGVDLHRMLTEMYRIFSQLIAQVDPARFEAYTEELLARLRRAIQQAAAYGNPPVIEGPFAVNATPPPTIFSGTNLGGVIDVTMRYVPAGSEDGRSIVSQADFVVQQSVGSTATVLVRNLPDYSSLDDDYPPIVTLVFNSGVKGQGIAAVRYQTAQVSVFGPTAAEFKGLEVRRISNVATYGNTASYFMSYLDRTVAPLYVGPLPKLWPGATETFASDHPVMVEDQAEPAAAGEPANSRVVSPKAASVQALRFDVRGFNPETILDVRVRLVPSENQSVQRAFVRPEDAAKLTSGYVPGGRTILANGITTVPAAGQTISLALQQALYYQIDIQPEAVTIWVEEDFVPTWNDKNFVMEYVFYDGPINGDNCRGLVLNNRGLYPSPPANGSAPASAFGTNGDYVTYADGAAWVKRGNTWVASTPLYFRRHQFSVVKKPVYIPPPPPVILDTFYTLQAVLEDGTEIDTEGAFTIDNRSYRERLPFGGWAKENSLVKFRVDNIIDVGSLYYFKRYQWYLGGVWYDSDTVARGDTTTVTQQVGGDLSVFRFVFGLNP